MNDTNPEIQHDTNNPGYLVAGLLLGGLLGALVGALVMLLLAPQSGKKTRKQIRRKVRAKAQHVSTSLHDRAEDLQQRGQDIIDEQRERWSPVVEAGKTAVNG